MKMRMLEIMINSQGLHQQNKRDCENMLDSIIPETLSNYDQKAESYLKLEKYTEIKTITKYLEIIRFQLLNMINRES